MVSTNVSTFREVLQPISRPATLNPEGAVRGRVRLRVEDTVPGIDPERARAWWTDFREGRHDHRFVPGARRSLEERPDGVVIEDRVRWLGLPVFSERVRATERGNKVELVGENTWARFRARYVFEHTFDPEGTLVRLTAAIEAKGPLSWVQGLAKPLVRWFLGWDLGKHLEDLQSDLG